jgi:hypothetical protein
MREIGTCQCASVHALEPCSLQAREVSRPVRPTALDDTPGDSIQDRVKGHNQFSELIIEILLHKYLGTRSFSTYFAEATELECPSKS